MTFFERVWEQCSKIPKGKVTTYKEIAKSLNTKAYRAVGQALKNNPYAPKVPCHRVVKSDGTLGGYQEMNFSKKEKLLRIEGIILKEGKIKELKKRLYRY